jgi:hypothetical protein
MPGQRIFNFGEYFILEKKVETEVSNKAKKMKFWRTLQFLKLKYLLDPNALKYLILHFF